MKKGRKNGKQKGNRNFPFNFEEEDEERDCIEKDYFFRKRDLLIYFIVLGPTVIEKS